MLAEATVIIIKVLAEAMSSSPLHVAQKNGGSRRPSYVAPDLNEKGPGGFVYILESGQAASGLSHDTRIESVAVLYYEIIKDQITERKDYHHAMLCFETRHRIQDGEHKKVGNRNADEWKEAYTSQRYCVQLNPMSFCERIVDNACKSFWVELKEILPENTDLEEVPFVSITDHPDQKKNKSLGRIHVSESEVRARSKATVADLVKITKGWLCKNSTYKLHEADCRHFALELYNKLSE